MQAEIDILAEQVADFIVRAKRVVVFSGAGISTESGIPDFHSHGIWEKFDRNDFTRQTFVSSTEARKRHWQMLKADFGGSEVEPNAAHYALVDLYKLGKLDCVITQNGDNLHQRAGLSDDMVFELHGNTQKVVCLDCGRIYSVEHIKARIDTGEEIPDCEICHGLFKLNLIFWGDPLPQDIWQRAISRSRACDLLIIIGTTLNVYPAAYIPVYAAQAGAKLVIINLSSTPIDSQADIIIRAGAGEIMQKVTNLVKHAISK